MSERRNLLARMGLSFRAQGTQNHQPKWQGTAPLTGSVIIEGMGLGGGTVSVTNAKAAMGIAAAARATAILTGAVAGVPKTVVDGHGAEVKDYKLVNSPNPYIDDFQYWEHMMMRLLYNGNFYALKQTPGIMQTNVEALIPLHPDSVQPKFVTTGSGKTLRIVDILYLVKLKDGETVGLSPDEIFHVAGLGFDGLEGESVLSYARGVFESTASSEEFASKFFSQGSLMSGILTTDKRLDEQAASGLKQRWRRRVQGIQNAFDIVVLDSGTTFKQISINPRDAQWLEARQFNITEIARIYGVHPQLLMESQEGVAGADPEHKSADFVSFTLNNWTNRIASAYQRQLLPADHKLLFHTSRLVQPDERTRSSAAVMWRKAQVKSINDLRLAEGLPPIDDERANDPFYVAETATPTGPAAEPGTNQGAPEQPVPAEQDPTEPTPGEFDQEQ